MFTWRTVVCECSDCTKEHIISIFASLAFIYLLFMFYGSMWAGRRSEKGKLRLRLEDASCTKVLAACVGNKYIYICGLQPIVWPYGCMNIHKDSNSQVISIDR